MASRDPGPGGSRLGGLEPVGPFGGRAVGNAEEGVDAFSLVAPHAAQCGVDYRISHVVPFPQRYEHVHRGTPSNDVQWLRAVYGATVSELTWHDARALDRPVLVVAFAGMFDAGTVATGAIEWLVEHLDVEPLASIDPEQFLDFQQVRPQVELTDDGRRRVIWPELVAHATRRNGTERDLILLSGMEPQFRWRTFTELVIEIATRSRAEMIVTLGATPSQEPHTRPPVVFGSSTNAELASRLG